MRPPKRLLSKLKDAPHLKYSSESSIQERRGGKSGGKDYASPDSLSNRFRFGVLFVLLDGLWLSPS